MHTELFMRRMVKIIIIKTYANRVKQFKNGDFDINDKECSGHPTVVKKDELQKMGKSREKRWKILRLIYIVSIFFNLNLKK